MAHRTQQFTSTTRRIAKFSLAIAAVVVLFAGPVYAQLADTAQADFEEGDMWDCTNRQLFFDYPTGEVNSIVLDSSGFVVKLGAGGISDSYSFAAVVKIVTADGEQRAIYQLHDQVEQTGILDQSTGSVISGTHKLTGYIIAPDGVATVNITHTTAISNSIVDLINAGDGQVIGIAIDGKAPPVQPGAPIIYVQVNTFLLPTATDTRACGEYLAYFTPVQLVDTGRADGLHDGLLCNSGVKPYAVPPTLDLTGAWAEADIPADLFRFTLEFGGTEALTDPIAGGIELYDPTGGLPPLDPDWLFNNTGNWSFNFYYAPPDVFEIFASSVIDGSWTPIADADHNVFVDGNRIVMEIDYGEFPETVATWFATVTNFSVCDEVGLSVDLLPELPLPPRQAPATATATATELPPPTATATVTPNPTATATATAAPADAEEDRPSPIPKNPICGSMPLVVGLISLMIIRKSKNPNRRRSRLV